ncbi:MAG: class I SAM-dependent methyltransferase [bacterium]
MEHINCPMCGNGSFSHVASDRDIEYATSNRTFNFVQCEKCNLLYLNPRPVAEEASRIYPKTYHSVNINSPLHSDPNVDKTRERLDKNRCKDILSLLQPGDTVLDIGCGDARMLQLFKKFGPRDLGLVGIDINTDKEFIEKMKGEGITIINVYFEDFDMSRLNNIKVVIMNELMEHLWNPSLCLEKLFHDLKPGTYLSIETPDIDCISRRLFSKKYWGGYHFPRHLQLFSKKNLRYYLEKGGVEIVKQYSILAPSFWIITFRNILGLNSYERSKSIFEFLNFKNVIVLGTFTIMDFLLLVLGLPTATQRIIAVKR